LVPELRGVLSDTRAPGTGSRSLISVDGERSSLRLDALFGIARRALAVLVLIGLRALRPHRALRACATS